MNDNTTPYFILIFIAQIIFFSVTTLNQKKIIKKLPTTPTCEMVGLGKTRATIIERSKNTITVQCYGSKE